MGKLFTEIDPPLGAFIAAQRMFFVATAPLAGDGHVNLSPKGLDTLRVLTPTTLAYLDYVGSGAETIAHVRENGRIVLMLCAFQGPPRIVRFHGRGRILEPDSPEFVQTLPAFEPAAPPRAIIVVELDRISDSCGFGVPLYEFTGDRTQLTAWAARKGDEGLQVYQRDRNAASIDGIPALRWVAKEQA